jgi:Rps23 Pro-64 3,4-dihydroxylase Tpa1-like proline 4-hydroxylase
VFDQAQALLAELKMSASELSRFETELVAHGDGAFYARHIDTQMQAQDRPGIRVLSGVYYFHRLPKAFSGGALRLYGFGAGFVDIEPTHNSLLVFPSWARHEVRPVSCPSGAFMDSRFAINCWVYRPNPAGDAQSEPTKA